MEPAVSQGSVVSIGAECPQESVVALRGGCSRGGILLELSP